MIGLTIRLFGIDMTKVIIALSIMCMLYGCAKPKDGAPGAAGPQGAQGSTGGVGTAGPAGAAGSSGAPGTQMTFVQFCPGFTQSYPSTFAEYGICVSGVMYGVYSANGGFLAELPPGRYISNGINATCAFTLGNDCEVTP